MTFIIESVNTERQRHAPHQTEKRSNLLCDNFGDIYSAVYQPEKSTIDSNFCHDADEILAALFPPTRVQQYAAKGTCQLLSFLRRCNLGL